MNSLKRKLIMFFRENMRLSQENLKRRLNRTEETGTGEMLILLFVKLADSSNPKGWMELVGYVKN